MKLKAIIFLILSSTSLWGQTDSIDIDKCRKLTIERYPLVGDLEKNLEVNQLKIENFQTIYLPTLQLTGQLIHLADVPHLAVANPLFTIPVVGKDQYKIAIEARQVIYDGGLTKRRRELEQTNLLADNQDIEVKLYQLNDQVNELYFMVLMFQDQFDLLALTRANLEEQLKLVESGVRNGVTLPGDVDVIKAEILKLDQKTQELHSGKASGIEMLSELMDTTMNNDIKLTKPINNFQSTNTVIYRPEYKLLELQSDKISKVDQLNKAYRFPYLGLFGQFGYGYPGMNMLEDKANIIYSFGINFSWTIWDWGKVRRDSKISVITSEKLTTQREIFDKNLNMSINKEVNNIKQLEESIKTDNEIIALRERISSAKASQMKNGVVTTSEYIIELNAETQAKINKQLHEIQLLKSIYKFNTLKGNLDPISK